MTSATRARATDEGAEADGRLAADLRLAVGRLARSIRQHASAGLTPSQFSALSSIESLAPVRLVDLATAERVSGPTLTKVVAALVDAGLVSRVPDPTDRRSQLLSLSAAGRSTLAQVRRQRTARLAERLAGLPAEQREIIARAVPVLAELAGDPPAKGRP
jgi:DNA-binding MarR family transcriptional regulator